MNNVSRKRKKIIRKLKLPLNQQPSRQPFAYASGRASQVKRTLGSSVGGGASADVLKYGKYEIKINYKSNTDLDIFAEKGIPLFYKVTPILLKEKDGEITAMADIEKVVDLSKYDLRNAVKD